MLKNIWSVYRQHAVTWRWWWNCILTNNLKASAAYQPRRKWRIFTLRIVFSVYLRVFTEDELRRLVFARIICRHVVIVVQQTKAFRCRAWVVFLKYNSSVTAEAVSSYLLARSRLPPLHRNTNRSFNSTYYVRLQHVWILIIRPPL